MNFTIIVPFYNEQSNISIFHKEILNVISKVKKKHTFELIYIDDGSTDNTKKKLLNLKKEKFLFKLIIHKKNHSQSSAIQSGIDESKFENLIFLDGDLQNDPADIKKLIHHYSKNKLDMIIGWRKKRKDDFLRTLSSIIANKIISSLTNSKIHDNGCALKILKKKLLTNMNLWGDFHRLIAARLTELGANIDEIEVNHRRRISGNSKYGFARIFNVLIDIIFIKLFYNNKIKPLYVFGNFGLFSFFISISSLIYMFYLKIFLNQSFITTPLPLLTSISFLMGLIFLSIGTITNLLDNISGSLKKDKNYQLIKK
jgi:glycosyltransferase involved in cell wall biosynthesis